MSRAEIDAAIAKHVDTELLYDQPYEDNKRIRVTGPFTVESLSPHRVLSDECQVTSDEKENSSFVSIILENLRKAGIQSTRKSERIRNSSTDDIACWFVDTDYNGESFFVRQAYFTGADEPYEKLKRALRAEIDEAAWQTLYSTTSRPFPSPKNKKIAVKVINHYGDEVLKVHEV